MHCTNITTDYTISTYIQVILMEKQVLKVSKNILCYTIILDHVKYSVKDPSVYNHTKQLIHVEYMS